MNDGPAMLDSLVRTAPKRLFTYDEVVAEFPETNEPCELWDGELIISPSPSFFHQKIVIRVSRWLDDWVTQRNLGEVIVSPLDMVLSPHRVTQPDIGFIAKDRLSIIGRVINGPVDLAIEVISLGNRNRDRIEKRDLYEQYGVKEYWIIDPEAETVDVLWLENGRYQLFMRSGAGQLASSRVLPGFELPVTSIFQKE
jgi:Uma2 family endonuclease